jgi:excisionase family DNA binding protein
MDELLTTKQIQALLKVDRTTIYRMLNDSRLNGVKVGGQWRFHRKDVEALLSTSPAIEPAPRLSREALVSRDCLQTIQDVFSDLADVGAIITTVEGQPITESSHLSQFCRLIQSSESGRQACIACWRDLVEQPENRPLYATCHAGLQYARARIEVSGKFVGNLVAGQFHINPPDASEEATRIQRLAAEHHLDAGALAEAAQEIQVLDETRRANLGPWLKSVARALEHIGRERLELVSRLEKIADISTRGV